MSRIAFVYIFRQTFLLSCHTYTTGIRVQPEIRRITPTQTFRIHRSPLRGGRGENCIIIIMITLRAVNKTLDVTVFGVSNCIRTL